MRKRLNGMRGDVDYESESCAVRFHSFRMSIEIERRGERTIS